MNTDRQETARQRGWHITGCKAIKTVYKQTLSWVWLSTVTGLGWGCSDTVRAPWVPVLGNRGEHWDSESGNGDRGELLNPQNSSAPKFPQSCKRWMGNPRWLVAVIPNNNQHALPSSNTVHLRYKRDSKDVCCSS